MTETIKVSPYPIPELKEFLRPFRQHFYRAESLHTLERFSTGLLADIAHKSGAGIAAAVADLSDSALYRLMTETAWDAKSLNQQRVQTMTQRAVAGDGLLVVDDT
jgi:SRSO17 transposase